MNMEMETYNLEDSIVIWKTKQKFGPLSNMARGFSLSINSIIVPSSEALYQAMRFPFNPDVQMKIIEQQNPFQAKQVSRKFISFTRFDWEKVKVEIMRWCLRVKIAQHWEISNLLLSTENRPIVERSSHDDFWGAKVVNNALVGSNVLGKLWMEVRQEIREKGRLAFIVISPPKISDCFLLGQNIKPVNVFE